MQKQQSRRPRLNNQIREPQVRVIDFDGKQLGTMTVQEALKIANERGFDLVEVGPFVRPPIAKIMDYGKYIYQKEKKERHAGSAKSPAHEVKTVKIGFACRLGNADKTREKEVVPALFHNSPPRPWRGIVNVMTKLKLKTSKSALKRFRFSSKGKIQHRRTHMNHFNAKESGGEKRDKRSQKPLARSDEQDIRSLMPYCG